MEDDSSREIDAIAGAYRELVVLSHRGRSRAIEWLKSRFTSEEMADYQKQFEARLQVIHSSAGADDASSR